MANETTVRRRALITGASSGIGAAFAERLAHDHYDLILVARRERLEALAQRLQAHEPINAEVLVADLARADELRVVEQRIAAEPALELLVNNAGFGGYMPFVTLDADRAEELIQLQVVAVTRLTRGVTGHDCAGSWRDHQRLFPASFDRNHGLTTSAKTGDVCRHQGHINVFTQLLQNELEGTGVQVQALCPGIVATEFHERVGADPGRFPASAVMQPEDLVAASLAGLRLGEVICVPALEDSSLMTQLQASEQRVFEQSRSGTVATRYKV